MPMAAGSQRDFFHVKEVTPGVDPGTPYTKDRFLVGARLMNEMDEFKSDELTADRSVSPGANGAKHAKFTGPFELSYGTFDDWIESAMCSAWAAAGSAVGSQTVTVVAGATNTMAATAIGTGLAVGDWIKVSGFAAQYAANNGFFRVTVQATGTITLGEAKNADGTSRLAAVAGATSISVQKMGYIVAGATSKALAIECARADVNVFERGLGFLVNRLSLSVKANAKITGSLDAIGLQLPAPAAVKFRTGTDVAATTSAVMTSATLVSQLWVDGAAQAIVTGIDFTLDNGMMDEWGVFQTAAYEVLKGRSNLTGSLIAGLVDATLHAKAYAGTRAALRTKIMDALGTSGYAFDLPTVKLSLPGEDTQENKTFQTFNWQAEKDATTGIINWKIWKLA